MRLSNTSPTTSRLPHQWNVPFREEEESRSGTLSDPFDAESPRNASACAAISSSDSAAL
eukprot:CAMPEP_0180171956 /NCGR_PEP_ID=MMETSP0986-20121125/34734_1 /TAXON_ID=697907 /ORGANISM="non described non described, Strain CCMP2293" /LENGTH=58 /DNA_ID=CAMNT_0022123943 /DNA_START=1034 /DNA_END=1210 /DNA_ORIENTATION=+